MKRLVSALFLSLFSVGGIQAQEALKTQQWERAHDLLRRMYELRPDFRDVSALWTLQERLRDLYDQAVQAMSARRSPGRSAKMTSCRSLAPISSRESSVSTPGRSGGSSGWNSRSSTTSSAGSS